MESAMDAKWYAENNPFKREPQRNNSLIKRSVAVALILGILFVASGFLHATDTRGTAMVASPANMAALRRVNASRAARVVEAPTLL